MYELEGKTASIADLGDETVIRAPVWDDQYWYRRLCFERCDERTSMSRPAAVERIDRKTGERTRLGQGNYGMGRPVPSGDYVYWGIYGHQIQGGMSRIKKSGGTQEHLALDGDNIEELVATSSGIVARGAQRVGWLAAGSAEPVVLAHVHANAAVVDGIDVLVTDEGGFIRRLSITDRSNVALVGAIKSPVGVAAYKDTVYFTLRESPDIWSVAKSGGVPRIVLRPTGRKPCTESQGLWATEVGLVWSEGGGAWSFDPRVTLSFAPWSTLGPSDPTR